MLRAPFKCNSYLVRLEPLTQSSMIHKMQLKKFYLTFKQKKNVKKKEIKNSNNIT